MQEDLQIKRLCVEDAAMLAGIATKSYSDHYADTWYDEGKWYLQTYFSVPHLEEELRATDARFFAVYYQREAVGFLKLNLKKPPPRAAKKALELERIYLAKNAIGKGIGTELLLFVFETAKQEKMETIWLKVMDTSPGAVRFYQKMRFEICGVHQVDFLQKKEGMRGMYLMQKKL